MSWSLTCYACGSVSFLFEGVELLPHLRESLLGFSRLLRGSVVTRHAYKQTLR